MAVHSSGTLWWGVRAAPLERGAVEKQMDHGEKSLDFAVRWPFSSILTPPQLQDPKAPGDLFRPQFPYHISFRML